MSRSHAARKSEDCPKNLGGNLHQAMKALSQQRQGVGPGPRSGFHYNIITVFGNFQSEVISSPADSVSREIQFTITFHIAYDARWHLCKRPPIEDSNFM